MNKKWVSAFGFILLMFTAVVWAAPLPDTGQTKCYNSTVEIPCPSASQPFYGQDASYSINPMSYTKLDGSGNTLQDDADSWVMVRDNVTGLIWENKQYLDGVKNYNDPHDADNTYTWYDSNPATNGGYVGTPGNGTDTEDFIKALNDAHYGGYSDWRLPTIKELASIVNYDIPSGPSINTSYFPNTVSYIYSSSTTCAHNNYIAWGVSFSDGNDDTSYKSPPNYVRAVRGGQYQSAYVNNGNGTVTDTSTGLTWELKTNKDGVQNYDDPHDADNTYTWEQALSNCETSTLAGYSDWRLPTSKELRSLVDYSRDNPAINISYFPDTVSVSPFYWSSTTGASHTYGAWEVNFSYGGGDYGPGLYNNKNNSYYVRAVRGGQPRISGHLIILSPNQADIWGIGITQVITWDTQNIAGNVKIFISRDGGKNYASITDATPNNGSYPWTVAGPASVNCMIKIEPLSDLTKGTVQGLFTISQKAGDVNSDDQVDLSDAILCLQVLSGMLPDNIYPAADVNGDGKIGMAEAIYVMQKVAGL